eukprot:gnl/TRDRNA2_/TRDRNA2_174230_c4_seq64.p1 gnl/TRDRNA2_/TRDRNA2_174230_c4~~gnl/TRDRNA2_/TRDRNA2_174230_c4_seq64.p1  ORF type:complete len:453 (-),score=93.78 gnl/TRDRNA2_/TRDRNA2_174230_c4_seq64:116-1474(-)
MASDTAKYVAEFVGTFLLVFTVGCNVITGSSVWAATSIACVLMVSIYALGGVSGANFNPAVSLALGLSKKLSWKDVGIYIAVQLVAGIAAGFAYFLMLGEVFNLAPAKGFNWWSAALVEILFTMMLCLVVLNVAASKAHAGKNEFYGLAIGFVIVAGAYAAGKISGGCFNPAVAFGIDTSSAWLGWGWCLPYMGFELIGAVLAAGVYRLLRPEDYTDEEMETPLYSQLLSEFLGVFYLVLVWGLNCVWHSPAQSFSIAAALMCMVFALGSVSGAHFNPAVTLAIMISGIGRSPIVHWAIGLAYMGVQFVGGVAGAYTYLLITDGGSYTLEPQGGFGWGSVIAAEIIFTFVLCFVVLAVATVESKLHQFFGLAIGFCVVVGGYAAGGISGGSINPAVSIGIAAGDLKNHPKLFWHGAVYAAVELVGGLIAAGMFRLTHAAEFEAGTEREKLNP